MQKDLLFIASSRYLKTLITHYDQLIDHYRDLAKLHPEHYEKYYFMLREILAAKKNIQHRIKLQLDQIKSEIAKGGDNENI